MHSEAYVMVHVSYVCLSVPDTVISLNFRHLASKHLAVKLQYAPESTTPAIFLACVKHPLQ